MEDLEKRLIKTGYLLIEEGIVTREDIQNALDEGSLIGTELARMLKNVQAVKREELASFLAVDYDFPVFKDVTTINFEKSTAKEISEDEAREYEIIPLAKAGSIVICLSPIPTMKQIRMIRAKFNCKVKIFVCDQDQFELLYEHVYRGKPLKPMVKTEVAEVQDEIEKIAEDAIPLIDYSDVVPETAETKVNDTAVIKAEDLVGQASEIKEIPAVEESPRANGELTENVVEESRPRVLTPVKISQEELKRDSSQSYEVFKNFISRWNSEMTGISPMKPFRV